MKKMIDNIRKYLPAVLLLVLLLFLYFLPNYLQLNGVWLAMPAAEFLTLFVTLYINHKFKHIL